MNKKYIDELFEIASAVCDETASDEQLNRLEGILAQHPEARASYSNYMLLHAELFWQQPAMCDDFAQVNAPSKNDAGSGRWWTWAFSLAAMLVIGSAVGVGAGRFFSSGNNSKVAMTSEGVEVAHVTQTRNCRWTLDGDEPVSLGFGSPIYAGQKLLLAEGVAELTINSGVRMILEAPAELDLSSMSESILHQGRLTASVPKGAEGFQVECPGITLVDRGTEFGVNSNGKGETEVHVFQGLVDGYVDGHEGGGFKKVSWKTNDVTLFNSATREFRDVQEPSVFVRSMSQVPASSKGLFASEDFDYAVGPLGGHNGGFGWGGPWENISFADGQVETNGVGGGSIPYESVDHLGNHALLSGQFNRIRRKLSTSFSGVFDSADLIENQDGSRLIGRDGKTLYMSYTQRVSKVGDSFYGFELNRGDGNRNRVLCIGHGAARAWFEGPPRTPNKDAGLTGWSVTSEFNGAENELMEIGELGDETTEPVLIVVRIDFGPENQDRVAVYLNPDPAKEGKPVVVGSGNFAFDRIGIANFEGDKSFQIDHLRLGLSYSSVINSQSNNLVSTSSKK